MVPTTCAVTALCVGGLCREELCAAAAAAAETETEGEEEASVVEWVVGRALGGKKSDALLDTDGCTFSAARRSESEGEINGAVVAATAASVGVEGETEDSGRT